MKLIFSIIFSINFVLASSTDIINHGKSAATEEARVIIIDICEIPDGRKYEKDIASLCNGAQVKDQLVKKLEAQNEKINLALTRFWMSIPNPKQPEPPSSPIPSLRVAIQEEASRLVQQGKDPQGYLNKFFTEGTPEHSQLISWIEENEFLEKYPEFNLKNLQRKWRRYYHRYVVGTILRRGCNESVKGEECKKFTPVNLEEVPYIPNNVSSSSSDSPPKNEQGREILSVTDKSPIIPMVEEFPPLSEDQKKRLEKKLSADSKLPQAFSGFGDIGEEARENLEQEAQKVKHQPLDFLEKSGDGNFVCGETPLAVSEEKPLCVDWYKGVTPIPKTTQAQLSDFADTVFYKEIAAMAAKKAWASYSLSIMSQDSFAQKECSEQSPGKDVETDIFDAVERDTISNRRNKKLLNKEVLKSCFNEKLGFNNILQETVDGGKKIRCEKKSKSLGGCSSEAEEVRASELKKRRVERFKKRVFQLKKVKDQIKKLREGNLKLPGVEYECDDRFKTCGEFFENQLACDGLIYKENLDTGGALIRGCVSVDMIYGKYRKGYEIYKNLKDLENYILSKNPELSSKVGKGKESKYYYETIINKKPKDKNWEKFYDRGQSKTRKESISFILDEICSNPNEFAEKMFLKNPALINEYLKRNETKELNKYICHLKAKVNIKHELNQAFHTGAIGATVLLGFAAAIPTGGTSLAWGLGTAATLSGIGLAGHTLYQAKKDYQFETGMLHGCIGDFNRMEEAEEAIDDAMIAAALELAIPIGIFTGLTLAKKLSKLSKIAKDIKQTHNKVPAFVAHLDEGKKLSGKVSKGQRQLIKRNYELGVNPDPEIILAIDKLEKLGFSKTKIKSMLNIRCAK
ncbi:MAG: hypothetical protein CME61_01130 [Halobacteriovoraceae bacterium]|nr:hypothetical protein [Halobacteriovoraceae bacterium]